MELVAESPVAAYRMAYKAELQELIDGGDLEGARQLVMAATRDGLITGIEGAADTDLILDAAYRMVGR